MTVDLQQIGRAAREAAFDLASRTTEEKNQALEALAAGLEAAQSEILSANESDLLAAKEAGLSEAMLDRLALTPERVAILARDVRRVIALDDPVGKNLDQRKLENGMTLIRRREPLGVIGVIYEARPNVTVDTAALCLKTGNASILRGGSETFQTNMKIVEVIRASLAKASLPEASVSYIEDTDRALVTQLLRMDQYVDMIIPRGGAGLHRLCREQGTIPVITGGIGICHIFADATARIDRALDIIENAKVQRPSVCNALDTLLVHREIAEELIPRVVERLAPLGVSFKADGPSLPLADGADPAGPDDFDTEWLSLVLGIKVVSGVDEAVAHIRAHSTDHSDSILTEDDGNAEQFVRQVSSAAVYVNASTRFTDGSEFGLGAEVAVSTQKLHARGPMGLEDLTTYKWIGLGSGQVRG